MKYIRARFTVLSGFALLFLFTNIYGTILLKDYGSIAFAQENTILQQGVDGTTPHISGTLTSPNDPADTKSTHITTDKDEIPSKTQKNNEQDSQSINLHVSGSTSGVVLDGNQ